jgi:hypothetical protein
MSKKFTLVLLAGAFLSMAAGFESASALNPQPLPPMKHPVATVVTHGGSGSRYLNPQPLPPG